MRVAELGADRGSGRFVRPREATWELERGLRLEMYGMSEVGPVRRANEDAFVIEDVAPAPADGPMPFFGVADGVGGHPGGAQASRLVLRTAVREALRRGRMQEWASPRGATAVETSLTELARACHDAIVERGTTDETLAHMATTLTAGVIRGRTLHIVHVGDSRCYLARDGTLRQLTEDQTMARLLEASGVRDLPAASALHHMLTNVLAAHRTSVQVDTHSLQLEPDDTLVFCTDGLSNALGGDVILEAVTASESPASACERLVRGALEEDGTDNVTAIVGHLATRASRPDDMR